MARLHDLKLSDAPDDAPSEQEGWMTFLTEIEDLLSSEEYDWASDTLEGIYNTVEQRQVVTPGQRDAVENITAAKR